MRAGRLVELAAMLFAALVGGLGAGVLLVLDRRHRREDARDPTQPPPPRQASQQSWLEEPYFPARVCAACDRDIVKRREDDRMWTRIHGGRVRHLHQACADERGEPLGR